MTMVVLLICRNMVKNSHLLLIYLRLIKFQSPCLLETKMRLLTTLTLNGLRLNWKLWYSITSTLLVMHLSLLLKISHSLLKMLWKSCSNIILHSLQIQLKHKMKLHSFIEFRIFTYIVEGLFLLIDEKSRILSLSNVKDLFSFISNQDS